jgi:Fe-S cluster assembly protein SufD
MSAAILPNRRDEAWRYSDLRAALIDTPAPLSGEGHIIERLAAGAGARTCVQIAAGENRDAFIALHGAHGLNASAELVRVEAGGRYRRVVIQTGAGVIANLACVELGEGATFEQFTLAMGAKFARLETQVDAHGARARVDVSGVYLCGRGDHADLTSTITHAALDGVTRQLIKGAARAGGRGVFQGKILVAQGAQKTEAAQNHHALLLEEGAEIYAKPELEIYADDVACAHGNTAGALDDGAVFYLRSRGVPENQARALLTEAFLLDALPDWITQETRELIEGHITAWLEDVE